MDRDWLVRLDSKSPEEQVGSRAARPIASHLAVTALLSMSRNLIVRATHLFRPPLEGAELCPQLQTSHSCRIQEPPPAIGDSRSLLGHTKLESTVRYLGIEVDDALVL